MAKLLLLETATDVCSVAVSVDGQLRALTEELEANRHASVLTLLIEQSCRDASVRLSDLDAVAVSRGPGSYTSLRVGASTAKGLAYALNIPFIAVDTLQALALASAHKHPFPDQAPYGMLPMIDARRMEVWTALFDQSGRQLLPPQPLIFENNLFYKFEEQVRQYFTGNRLILSGNGVYKTGSASFFEPSVVLPDLRCSAAHLVAIAEQKFQDIDYDNIIQFEPFYMKAPNITESTKKHY
jgi:tRNA threonylcarbamoyladenosine biosynthesis protein TsaB